MSVSCCIACRARFCAICLRSAGDAPALPKADCGGGGGSGSAEPPIWLVHGGVGGIAADIGCAPVLELLELAEKGMAGAAGAR